MCDLSVRINDFKHNFYSPLIKNHILLKFVVSDKGEWKYVQSLNAANGQSRPDGPLGSNTDLPYLTRYSLLFMIYTS